MTKKEFKLLCNQAAYTKPGTRINAIFYGYSNGRYKYMAWTDVKNCTKKQLFDIMYDWCIKDKVLPWWVSFKKAETEEQMFKIPITIR